MDYIVQLNNGQSITLAGAEFDAIEFTANLNNQQTIFVVIGGAIVNKHLIQAILPVQATETA